MSGALGVSYQERIKKIFRNAYLVREPNKYGGPIWFKYAVFCGENKHCKDTLLGLGMGEEKAWLDAYYGFKFLKVHLGMEKKREYVTAGNMILDEVEKGLESKSETKGESGVGIQIEEEIVDTSIAMIIDDLEEICIQIESDKVLFEEKLHIRKKVQCDSFIRDGKNKWIQCECFSTVKVGIEYPGKIKGIVELYLCDECFKKSDNGKVKMTIMEKIL